MIHAKIVYEKVVDILDCSEEFISMNQSEHTFFLPCDKKVKVDFLYGTSKGIFSEPKPEPLDE
jgi:hypothetical protein